MTNYIVHNESTAPEASKDLIRTVRGRFGFLPNLYAVMAESPAVAEAYQALSEIFNKTSLSETERQVILMTNNRLNGCDYCMAAHTTISQMANVPADVIHALRDGVPIADHKLEALRQFAVRVNESRGWVDQSDLDAFFAAGYDKANALDVILGTSLKVLSNYTNHITETPVDAAFQANSWPDSKRLAA